MGWQDWSAVNMYALVTWEGQTLLDFWCCVLHATWNEWSDVSKNLFRESASSKFAFPDWARVKCRQQRFLEHCDKAKPPRGSWAILLFKVWTGAAFICHCILHRSVSSSLCVALFRSVSLTLWFYMDICSLGVHLLSPYFFLSSFLSLYPGKQGQRPKGCRSECLMLCEWKFYVPFSGITGIIWFFMRVFDEEMERCSDDLFWLI